MARLARVVAPGLPHHVTQRGNRRQETFFCEEDYEQYIRLMSEWCSRRWQAIRQTAERKLAQLHAAATLDFLRSPPGNRLEALKGDRVGQWSIRINDQWRVCFRWADGDVFDVEIVDYH